MAKLAPDLLRTIFQLQQRLIELIDEAGATEQTLFQRFGEAPQVISELEEAQNARERLRSSYAKLSNLVLAVAEYQPIAPKAVLNLLSESIEQAQAIADAAQASLIEIKRIWGLL